MRHGIREKRREHIRKRPPSAPSGGFRLTLFRYNPDERRAAAPVASLERWRVHHG
jgi:hypothetical protein